MYVRNFFFVAVIRKASPYIEATLRESELIQNNLFKFLLTNIIALIIFIVNALTD